MSIDAAGCTAVAAGREVSPVDASRAFLAGVEVFLHVRVDVTREYAGTDKEHVTATGRTLTDVVGVVVIQGAPSAKLHGVPLARLPRLRDALRSRGCPPQRHPLLEAAHVQPLHNGPDGVPARSS